MKQIYCDGACSGNPGPGGWGVFLIYSGKEVDIYGHSADTTNNKMELQAAIVACKLIANGEEAKIYLDSDYVRKGITEWIIGWKKKGWKTAKNEPVKNVDLWKELDELVKGKKIQWEWVKGHSGNSGNDRADKLAVKGRNGNSIEHTLEKLISEVLGQELPKVATALEVNPLIVELGDLIQHNQSGEQYIFLEKDISVWSNKAPVSRILQLMNEGSFVVSQEQLNSEFKVTNPVSADMFKILLKKLKEHNRELYNQKKDSCKHVIVEKGDSAYCALCSDHFGWYCPDSPDHSCHYFSHAGKVELSDGTLVDKPANDYDGYETDDMCLFCGDPQERK
jgi:ribonuclease HI